MPQETQQTRQGTKPTTGEGRKNAIITRLTLDIEAANGYYEGEIEPLIIERYEVFRADKKYYRKMFPVLSKRCEITSTDVQDTIESTMPALMETFFGSTEVISVQGMDGTPQDEERAEKFQALLNYQLDREQFFMTAYQWFKDALITNMGIIKVDWERTYRDEVERVPILPQVMEQFQQDTRNGTIKVLGMEEAPEIGGVIATVSRIDKNQPRIRNVLASEFRFSPDAVNLRDADFVAHRKIVTLDYLRKQAKSGLYENVEELVGKAENPHYTQLDQINNQHIDDEPNTTDSGRRKVELYECYVNLNMTDDDDGELTPMIVTISNGVILRMEENTYERNPFFILSPRLDPHKVWPESGFVDLIAQIQHTKTAIYRQIIYNMAQTNDSKMAVNLAQLVDINDITESRRIIRVNGNVTEGIMNVPVTDLAPWTFSMLEYLDTLKENRTGITKYNQGMDSNSLNKMLDIETPIPMADGSYKLLRDIVDGDRIIGRNGKPVTVLKAHEIHYPERAYNITFKNGETICAGGEHLWTIRKQSNKVSVMDTDTIAERMAKYRQPLYIPTVGQVDFESSPDLPVDPYILGAYLGNGHKHSCRITTMDDELVEIIGEKYTIEPCKTGQNSGKATTYTITNGLFAVLHELGIVKREAIEKAEKYIPEVYFHAPYQDRLNLLRGLMDTDGCHHSGALVVFTQAGGRLLSDTIRLINSFGWRTHRHEIYPEQAVDGKQYWQVTFSADDNPFRIHRKADKWAPRTRQNGWQRIVDIRPAAMRLMRCLTVDAEDGLFCVGRLFTVTHNTATGVNIITQQASKRLELIARIFAETGIREMFKFLIKINQLFVNQEVVVRLTNGTMPVDPTDLEGDFDLIISTGMGAGAQQQRLNNLLSVGQLLQQLFPQGMVGPEEMYNYAKKFIEECGYKNADDFIRTPEETIQAMQEQQEAQVAGQAMPISERLNIAYEDLPWQVQMEMFQKEGYQVDPSWWTEKATEDYLKNAVNEYAKADAQKEDVHERIAGRRAKAAEMATAGGAGQTGRGSAGANAPIPQ